MTPYQRQVFAEWLQTVKIDEFHHGLCVGADCEAHKLVREFFPACRIVGHPGTSPNGYPTVSSVTRDALFHDCQLLAHNFPYLVRDRHIVQAGEFLIATPAGQEIRRSGTWTTVRYAIKSGTPVKVILPKEPTNG
jgi:hypothetical protein